MIGTKRKARKRRSTFSQKKLEKTLRRWANITDELSKGIHTSTRITGEDLRIVVY